MKRIAKKTTDNLARRTHFGSIFSVVFFLLLVVLPLQALAGKGRHEYRGDRGTEINQGRHEYRGGRGVEVDQGRYVINYGDRNFLGHGGEPSVLFLKRELLYQYPGLDVTNLRLREVVLVAKSKIGRGVAQLRVGPEISNFYQVAGRPRDFFSRNRYTFARVNINNPFRQSWGPWQLHLKGNFKVRKVILIVEERSRPQYQYGQRGDIGQFQFNIRW